MIYGPNGHSGPSKAQVIFSYHTCIMGETTLYIVIMVERSMQQAFTDKIAIPRTALTHTMKKKYKYSKLLEDCQAEEIEFMVMPVEVQGCFHSKTVDIVTMLGRQLSSQTSRDEVNVINHIVHLLLDEGECSPSIQSSPKCPVFSTKYIQLIGTNTSKPERPLQTYYFPTRALPFALAQTV